MPPPVHTGDRLEPARARPVPFWRQGLEPPPETIPRVFVAAVPRRRAACSDRTLSCTSAPWKRAPKAASSSWTRSPEATPSTGASAIAAHLHHAVARAGHRAAHEHQVLAGVERDDLEALLGDARVAHLAGAANALDDPRRGGRRADRARGAHVVGAVRLGAALEVVALDRPLEALAL